MFAFWRVLFNYTNGELPLICFDRVLRPKLRASQTHRTVAVCRVVARSIANMLLLLSLMLCSLPASSWVLLLLLALPLRLWLLSSSPIDVLFIVRALFDVANSRGNDDGCSSCLRSTRTHTAPHAIQLYACMCRRARQYVCVLLPLLLLLEPRSRSYI